jgi:Tol biopolymer transport system component/tetratricopeptide (TPR) repeat protein
VCFTDAIEEDPHYAPAHAGVADYYISLGIWGGLPPLESFAAAKESACKAIELDATLPAAHVSLAVALWAYDGALDEAEQHFHLAITRNPDYPDAHFWFGMLNASRDRTELGIAYLERARKLAPLSPSYVTALASICYNARQFDRAIQILNEAAGSGRTSAIGREVLAACYLRSGRMAEALSEAAQAAQLSNRSASSLCTLAHVEAANGHRDRAAAIAGEMERQAEARYVSSYYRASTQLAAGNVDACLRLLRQAFVERDWMTSWLGVAPEWDAIRSDDRFRHLLAGEIAVNAEDACKTDTRKEPLKRSRVLTLALALFAVAVSIAVAWLWRFSSARAPFQEIQITKITSNGTALTAAISPDGNSVAYAAKENGELVIKIRRGAGSPAVRLTEPLAGEVRELDFTRGGKYISFVNFPSSQPSLRLLKLVPARGGAIEQLPETFPGPVSISPDGSLVAFLSANGTAGQDELWISAADGKQKRLLASFSYPRRFTWSAPPAWSGDGAHLACALEETDRRGFFIPLVVIDTRSGSIRTLRSPRWQWVQRMAWFDRDPGLAVIGQEQDSSFQQVWYVPFKNGDARRISNDLNDYSGVSLAVHGSKLVSVQLATLSNIYVADRTRGFAPTQITPGSGRYFDLSWTGDDRILYASDATGSADLWEMNGDGSGQRQLTSAIGRSYAPAASPDGKTVAYHSNRSGSWNIWKVNTGGAATVQLTSDSQDSNWPQFTPDGTSLVYHHTGANGMWNIWKIPVSGGKPVQLTHALTTHPAISRQTGQIGCWYSTSTEKPNWKLAILPPDGGAPLKIFDIAGTVVPDSNIRWTASGDGLTFLDGRGGGSNIWVQPVDGRPAHPLTSFNSGQIYSFDWSRDGRLAFSRGMSLSDVVVIREREVGQR